MTEQKFISKWATSNDMKEDYRKTLVESLKKIHIWLFCVNFIQDDGQCRKKPELIDPEFAFYHIPVTIQSGEKQAPCSKR